MDASVRDRDREESGSRRDESEKERLDRNLLELLQELRVAIPGVQVLFAFLLVVPFNQRFPDITSFQRTIYFVTLLLATAATACLIAPTAHHRVEFRAKDKKRIVFAATKLAIVGLVLLAAAMTGAVMLITDMLYHATTVAIVAGVVALGFLSLWFAWPVKRLLDSD
jgi:predicted membrane channel-forming protein YqfA (hemolysin III family)